MQTVRYFLSFVIVLLLNHNSYSQIQSGFNKYEAVDMARLNSSFTFLDLYNSDASIVPNTYEKYYTSGVFGMDNKFQIYLKDSTAIICFRGSTDKQISWLENFHAAMIPSRGTISVQGNDFNYCFANDTSASVHGGYALAMAYFHKDILFHINNLNRLGYYNIIITGHSQGGSLTNLLLAYLSNLPNGVLSDKNRYKVYAFAAPMVGNSAFRNEYNKRYCETGYSFNIINPDDNIPRLPMSLENSLNNPSTSDYKKLALEAAFSIFEKSITKSVHKVSLSTTKKIQKELGNIDLPPYTNEIQYAPLGNIINIPPFSYPLVLKDSSMLGNDSLMAIYHRNAQGIFYDKTVYKTAPMGYNHKPYNYYVSVLLKYFPDQYAVLKNKYLVENL